MRFILSVVLKRTVGFLTTVDVVLEEYKLVVLQSDYKKKTKKTNATPHPTPVNPPLHLTHIQKF